MALTSARPALTADSSSNAPRAAVATIRARVVFPAPGGPYSTIECGSPASIAVRSAEPSASRCSWPTSSSSVAGRIRTASGASAAGTGVRLPAACASSVSNSRFMCPV